MSLTTRTLAVAFVLAAGWVAARGLEAAMHATFLKPPAPLARPLDQLPALLGEPARYEATGPDVRLTPDQVEALGTADYLIRVYRPTAGGPSAQHASAVRLNLNYYAAGDRTPHVPETCWAGVGRVEVPEAREVFTVNAVPHRGGPATPLRVRLVAFVPDGPPAADPPPADAPRYHYVAYLFHVNGGYVATPREVAATFWTATNRYAYHAKIELTPVTADGRTPAACTRDEAVRRVGDFLRDVLPAIETCLPDPRILTSPATAPARPGAGTR
jgi:hypothetical protein